MTNCVSYLTMIRSPHYMHYYEMKNLYDSQTKRSYVYCWDDYKMSLRSNYCFVMYSDGYMSYGSYFL